MQVAWMVKTDSTIRAQEDTGCVAQHGALFEVVHENGSLFRERKGIVMNALRAFWRHEVTHASLQLAVCVIMGGHGE
jgi:hypothetical protein